MPRRAFLLVGVALVTICAAQKIDEIRNTMSRYSVSWKDAAQLTSMADQFNLSVPQLIEARRNYRLRNDDLNTGLYFRKFSRQDLNYVYKLRASGMGWGVIARKLRIHPGTFNKMRKSWNRDSDVYDDVWRYSAKPELAHTT